MGLTPGGRCWVVGDVHGQRARLSALLVQSGLLDRREAWNGGDATLVVMGDLTDRGPDGAGVVQLLRRLEAEAASAGGQVITLLGNHEVLLLSAARHGRGWKDAQGRSFHNRWRQGGGRDADLDALSPEDLSWLARLPALLRLGPYLFMHADSRFYLRYGHTTELINAALRATLEGGDPAMLDRLTSWFSERREFEGEHGERAARELLASLGGARIVHGHTPIPYVLGKNPDEVSSPLLYAGGLALNVDGGLAYGAHAGFLLRLGPQGVERVTSSARVGR